MAKHLPPSGISCIYCGCSLDSIQDGYDHQESGECPGPFDTNTKLVMLNKDGSIPPVEYTPRTPEQRAERLASMPMRPWRRSQGHESQWQRDQAVKAIREGK